MRSERTEYKCFFLKFKRTTVMANGMMWAEKNLKKNPYWKQNRVVSPRKCRPIKCILSKLYRHKTVFLL